MYIYMFFIHVCILFLILVLLLAMHRSSGCGWATLWLYPETCGLDRVVQAAGRRLKPRNTLMFEAGC